MNAKARKFMTAAGICLLLGTGMAIYVARGPAILLDLGTVGRFFCL